VTAHDEALDELAIRHGADKSSKVHGYTRAYNGHFAPLRHEPVRLLEIGVGDGASLRMWHDYFPMATICGLDVDDRRHLAGQGFRVFAGTQGDKSVLEKVVAEAGPFDIVIDDGSHRWSDQIFAFKTLFPHVQAGGYYVVEDLHTSYWDRYRSGEERTIWFLRELVHEINLHGKSGYGSLRNDPEKRSIVPSLNYYQQTIESITFYKSIAFVRKKEAEDS
jgi:demethylmacrocin O-methyltransferase